MGIRTAVCCGILALCIMAASCGETDSRKKDAETGAVKKDNAVKLNADDGQPPAPKPEPKPDVKPEPKADADAGKAKAGEAVTVKDHTFTLPAGWKNVPPAFKMRSFQADVPKTGDDKENAEFIVSVMPGGNVDQNIGRWAGQFGGADSLKNKTETKTAGGVTATVVELEGTYQAVSLGGPAPAPKENYKQLGAIVTTDIGAFFIKLTGPKKTIDDNKAAFDALIASFK